MFHNNNTLNFETQRENQVQPGQDLFQNLLLKVYGNFQGQQQE